MVATVALFAASAAALANIVTATVVWVMATATFVATVVAADAWDDALAANVAFSAALMAMVTSAGMSTQLAPRNIFVIYLFVVSGPNQISQILLNTV